MLWFNDRSVVLVQEAFWTKLFGLIPVLGVHVNGMEKGDDVGVFRDRISFELYVPRKEEKQINIESKLMRPIIFLSDLTK